MALQCHSPWDQVIFGTLLRPGQTAQLPLSAEVSLRTIRSRWKRWHLAFPCAPLLPVNGCLAVSSTSELVPQHSLVEAQAQLQSLSCRAACPSIPFVQGPIYLHKQAVSFSGNIISNELLVLPLRNASKKWTEAFVKWRKTHLLFRSHLTSHVLPGCVVTCFSCLCTLSACPAVWFYFNVPNAGQFVWRTIALSGFTPAYLSNYLFLIL